MKSVLTTIIILVGFSTMFSQNSDTSFYDNDWEDCTKDLAFYFSLNELDTIFPGEDYFYYISGEKYSLRNMKNGSLDGKSIWWYKNGQKWCEGDYSKGHRVGWFVYWYADGNKKKECFFKNGNEVGGWIRYDKSGIRYYGDEVDNSPLFMNAKRKKKSNKLLHKYLIENTNYPETSQENGIEGIVFVGFTIIKDGSVTDVSIQNGLNSYLDEEAIRVVEEMPNWTPGVHNGENVRVKYTIPIKFTLKK